MEYLDGADLQQIVKQRGPLPIEEAVSYLLQALQAVAEAHAAGIIHRDLKPSNLFVAASADGTPALKVLDFGISKHRNTDSFAEEEGDLTKTSMVLGTPHFMAPEQMRSARDVDERADIWSLGAIMYQLVTAERPFAAKSFPELVVKVIQEDPPLPSTHLATVPKDIDAVIMRCMAKEPDDRFADVAELARAVAPYGPPQSYQSADKVARLLGMMPPSMHPSGPRMPVPTDLRETLPKERSKDLSIEFDETDISVDPERHRSGATAAGVTANVADETMRAGPNKRAIVVATVIVAAVGLAVGAFARRSGTPDVAVADDGAHEDSVPQGVAHEGSAPAAAPSAEDAGPAPVSEDVPTRVAVPQQPEPRVGNAQTKSHAPAPTPAAPASSSPVAAPPVAPPVAAPAPAEVPKPPTAAPKPPAPPKPAPPDAPKAKSPLDMELK
jgi:serine/threonine-protein kinase